MDASKSVASTCLLVAMLSAAAPTYTPALAQDFGSLADAAKIVPKGYNLMNYIGGIGDIYAVGPDVDAPIFGVYQGNVVP